ncbi:MAG: hypothetical protein WDN49_20745 [Acetobacteraceae bacterium]
MSPNTGSAAEDCSAWVSVLACRSHRPGWARAAAASVPFPEGATLLVAGPSGGPVDTWAEWLAPVIGHALPPGTAIRKAIVGGTDGVTGANEFEARTVPDGSTALLLPGSAAMAWLVGDPRARFDAAHWVPALAGVTPGVIASRVSAAQMLSGTTLRIAASGPASTELPALLALDLLGVHWRPVFGLRETAAREALAQGTVDAVCLHGRRVAEMAQACAAIAAPPAFTFGVVDEDGRRQRDPAFADVPDASELLSQRALNGPLRNAWRATAAAAQLDIALVLPQLTPASMVALWRWACAQATESSALQAQASSVGVRPLSTPGPATTNTAAVAADAAALLELRHWLATRLDYRPA